MKMLTEKYDFLRAIEPQDVGTLDVTSAVYRDMSGVRRAVILASAGAVTAGKILTVTPLQATAADGTDSKALGDAVAKVGAGGNAPAQVTIEIRTEQLDSANGFKYVGVKLGIDENGKLGEAWIVLGEKRYV
jgi:hypothetical protein